MSRPIRFSHLTGNDQAKQYLLRMQEKESIGNSLLFSGPSGVGKSLFAQAFAEILLEKASHPDLHIYRPEGKSGLHSIESMRELCEDVYLAPFEAKWKVFIIEEADRMLPTSANALLKTFEEPAPDTVIILVTHHPEHLLPTVLSRCRTVYFQALSEEQIRKHLEEKGALEAEKIAKLSQGSLGNAYRLIGDGCVFRDRVLDVLSLSKFRNLAELSSFAKQLAEMIEKGEEEKKPEKEMSAAMQHQMQKDAEGRMRMKKGEEVLDLFQTILFWYRDLLLLQNNGNSAYVMHQDRLQELKCHVETGPVLSLSHVTQAIEEAMLSFERSSGLAFCLENLFLKLEFL